MAFKFNPIGVLAQQYGTATEAEKAQVQAVGESILSRGGDQQSAFEAAQRAGEAIFTQRSNAMMAKQITDAYAANVAGGFSNAPGVTIGNAQTLSNLEASGSVLRNNLELPAGSAGEANRVNIGTNNTSIALNKAQAPSNVGAITQGNNPVITEPTITSPNTSGSNSTYATSVANTKNEATQIEDFYKRMEAAQKEQAASNKTLLSGILGNQKTATALTAEEEARFGVDAKAHLAKKQGLEAGYASLEKDYTNAKNAMEAEKMAATDRLATTGSISSQQNAIERKYSAQLNRLASEMNYKGAEIARENGNYNEAMALVEKAVGLKLADQKMNLDMNLALYQENQDSFDKMQGIYKDAFVSHINSLEKQYTQDRADATAVGKLMIDNPQANILPSDTLNQAYAKVGLKPATSSQIIGSADNGYSNVVTDSSGKVISVTPVQGGGGGGGANTDVNTYAQSYLEGSIDIPNIPQAIRAKVLAKANEIAKAALAATPPVATPPPVTAKSAGQATGNVVKPLYEAFRPENLGAGAKSVANTVGNFFSGLFGG